MSGVRSWHNARARAVEAGRQADREPLAVEDGSTSRWRMVVSLAGGRGPALRSCRPLWLFAADRAHREEGWDLGGEMGHEKSLGGVISGQRMGRECKEG